MKTPSLIAICTTLAIVFIPGTSEAQKNKSWSCSFISQNALKSQGDCMFMDGNREGVLITPFRKISTNQAAQWIVNASAALQIGGEKRFNTITVLTSPDGSGEYAIAKSSENATIMQEPQVIKSLTKICKRPNDWSDVIGPDNKPVTPHKCRPLK